MAACDWFLLRGWTSGWPFKNAPGPFPQWKRGESRVTPQVVVEDITPEAANMVEKFVGTWKMVSSENFDDYMKAIGRRARGLIKLIDGKL